MEQLEGVKYTRASRKESLMENQLALTDCVISKNHTISTEGVRLPAKEPDWKKRGVKEAISLRKVEMCHQLGLGVLPPSSGLLEAAML